MDFIELKPTEENISSTLLNDSIGNNINLFSFLEFVTTLEGNSTVALNGRWGTGKTFFVKQAKKMIDKLKTNDANNEYLKLLQKYRKKPAYNLPVYYDAWENDNDEDPILSLIFEIISQLDLSEKKFKEKDWKGLIVAVSDCLTGGNLSSVLEKAKNDNILQAIKNNRDLHEKVNEFFNNLLPEVADRLIIFVDELDRCKPTYAIKLLERIKHYFDNDNITFVFSVNMEQLQHSIAKVYGYQFDSYNYLNRFFQYTFNMPTISVSKYFAVADQLQFSYLYKEVSEMAIDAFELSMRESIAYWNMSTRVKNNYNNDNQSVIIQQSDLRFFYHFFIPVMIILKIRSIDGYNDFINGNGFEYLKKLSGIFNNTAVYQYLMDNLMFNYDRRNSEKDGYEVFLQNLENTYKMVFRFEEYQRIKRNERPETGTINIYEKTKEIILSLFDL